MSQGDADQRQHDEDRVDKALAEYLVRIDRGEQIDREEFIRAYADIAEELRAYFANADAVEAAVSSGPTGVSPSPIPSGGTPPPLDVIRYFGDYELLEELGRGGMGVVYKARQQSLNRLVAVKMILAGALSECRDVERFHREAEAAANLKHPNIVAIHEVGEHEGRHYFSMDLIEGHSLAEMVREHPLPSRKAATYVEAVTEAIDYSHTRGTLHRDLKPSNILIDATDQPHVTDFGLAKRVGSDPDLTAAGDVMGTASYMPPEQAEGRIEEIGPASDVYSLGATLYDVITGRPPFRAETPVATLHAVIHDEPVPPRLLNSSIDRDLETICLKCLEKNSSRRYPTAAELADDLKRFLSGKAITARPVGRIEHAWRWCRRNPAVAALTSALLVSLLVGMGISAFLAVVASRRAADTAIARRQTEINYNRVFTAVDELYTEIGADPLLGEEVLKPLRQKFFEAGRKQFEAFVHELGGDAQAEDRLARATLLAGEVSAELGDYARATEAFQQAKDLLEDLVAKGEDSLDVLDDLATAYERLGGLYGTMDPYAIDRTNHRTSIAKRKHWHSKALQVRQELMRRDPTNPGRQNAVFFSQVNLGQAFSDGGENTEAIPLLEKACNGQESFADAHPESVSAKLALAVFCDTLAEALWRGSRPQDAAAFARKKCDVLESLVKAEPTAGRRRQLARSLDKLADRQYAAGSREQESLSESYRKAAQIYEGLLEDASGESWEVAALRAALSEAYFKVNESLSLVKDPNGLSVLRQRLDLIRKSRAVALPVVDRNPTTATEEAALSAAKELVAFCDDDIPKLEQAIQQVKEEAEASAKETGQR